MNNLGRGKHKYQYTFILPRIQSITCLSDMTGRVSVAVFPKKSGSAAQRTKAEDFLKSYKFDADETCNSEFKLTVNSNVIITEKNIKQFNKFITANNKDLSKWKIERTGNSKLSGTIREDVKKTLKGELPEAFKKVAKEYAYLDGRTAKASNNDFPKTSTSSKKSIIEREVSTEEKRRRCSPFIKRILSTIFTFNFIKLITLTSALLVSVYVMAPAIIGWMLTFVPNIIYLFKQSYALYMDMDGSTMWNNYLDFREGRGVGLAIGRDVLPPQGLIDDLVIKDFYTFGSAFCYNTIVMCIFTLWLFMLTVRLLHTHMELNNAEA